MKTTFFSYSSSCVHSTGSDMCLICSRLRCSSTAVLTSWSRVSTMASTPSINCSRLRSLLLSIMSGPLADVDVPVAGKSGVSGHRQYTQEYQYHHVFPQQALTQRRVVMRNDPD